MAQEETEPQYMAPNEGDSARERLQILHRQFDSPTIELLEKSGIAEGWRCLELGPGAGSMTEWLCRRVGESGSVLAIDLDTRFVRGLDYPQLEVREADVVAEDLGEGLYDLVYTRLTLMHIAERDDVFAALARAVRPGGCLAVVDQDFVTWMADLASPPETLDVFRMWGKRIESMASEGWLSLDFARRLPRLYTDAEFEDLDIHGRADVALPGSDLRQLWYLGRSQVREGLVERGVLTAEEAAAEVNVDDDPRFLGWGNLTVFALGRKPS
jgi:SAM-dependent methyltransferase